MAALRAADCITPPPGLAGWWSGDNHAFDLSGNYNHGESSGMAYATGKVQSSFSFDGASSKVRVSPSPELAVASLTFAAWINPRDGAYRPIITYQRDNAYRGALLWTGQWGGDSTAGSLYANLREGPGQEALIEASGVIATNQWSFVAVTYDHQSGLGRLYVNDQLVKESILPPRNPDTTGVLAVGHAPASVDLFANTSFNGEIDEAMVFNRPLSQAELKQFYDASSAGFCRVEPAIPAFNTTDPILLATNDLVAVYPLNGSAADASGHRLDGTLFGTSPATDRFGRTNGALRFSSTNDYVDLGNRPEFNFTNGFTLNAWIKAEQGPGGYILGKYAYHSPGNIQSHSYGLGTHDFMGPYGFVLGNGVGYQDIVAGPALNDGQWHLLTLTFEDNVGISLYADGFLRGTRSTGDLPPLTNSLPLLIGKITTGLPFTGSIDDVSLYRRPLRSTEVRLLHNYQRYYEAETPVPLSQPTSTFSQTHGGDQFVSHVSDGIIDELNAWGIFPEVTNQTAVFETGSDVGFEGGTVLSVNLIFNHPSVPGTTSHTIGRFRLSATTDPRDMFADGLLNNGDVTANWSQLGILSATAASGAVLTVLEDNSILVSGALSRLDTYTIDVATRLTGITGVRLEVLQHPSLPFNGPGREPLNGNFALSEMLVAARPGGGPLITGEPNSLAVTNGASAVFTVSASSSLPVSYQWFRNGSAIAGATNSSLTVEDADFGDAGTYTVQIDNAEGFTVSSGAVLNLRPADLSGFATLSISNFDPVAAHIFDIGGKPLTGPGYFARVYAGPSAESLVGQGPAVPFLTGTNAGFFIPVELVLTNVVPGADAFVQVRVWESAAGSTFEAAVQSGGEYGESAILEAATGNGAIPAPKLQGLLPFSLVAAPRIVAQPVSQTVYVGEQASFEVQAWGSGPLSFEWFLKGSSIGGTASNRLVLTNLQVEQSGEIHAIIRNSVGVVTSAVATLTVLTPDVTAPEITIGSPAAGTTFDTHVTLAGLVTDDRGVASAAWTQNGQARGEITLEEGRFSITNIALVRGLNVFRVSATDTSSNTASVEVTVTNVASRAVYVGQIPPHQEGAMVRVPLFIESRGDVGGLDFMLGYDRNYIADPDVQWGEALQGAVTQASTNLQAVIGSFALSGSTLPTGAVQFATVVFRSRSIPGARAVLLPLNVGGLYNSKGDPLSATGTDVRAGRVDLTVRDFVGDNNANDRLDIGDAAIIMRLANRVELPRAWDTAKNDLNRNFQLDAGDVIRVLRAVVGLDPQPSLPGALASAGFSPFTVSAGNTTLLFDRATAAPGEQVKLTVNLSQLSKPLDAAAFRLRYPTNALRLESSAAHRTGNIVPSTAAVLWNVSPGQNDYHAQEGAVSLAVSSDRAWPTNQGVLAEFTFTVQAGATNQHRWVVSLESELSSGYELLSAPAADAFFTGRAALPPEFNATPALTEEGISLSFAAESGLRYRIEVSEDLATWTPLATVESAGGVIHHTDPLDDVATRRFYRAVQVD